jgi:hypothetical protein
MLYTSYFYILFLLIRYPADDPVVQFLQSKDEEGEYAGTKWDPEYDVQYLDDAMDGAG